MKCYLIELLDFRDNYFFEINTHNLVLLKQIPTTNNYT